MLDASPCVWGSEEGGYGSLKVASSFDTTCSSKTQQCQYLVHSFKYVNKLSKMLTSVFFGLLAGSSCVGECGLLEGAPLTESSRPLGSSLGLLVAVGFALPVMELLAGGEGGFALRGGSSG